jgi:alkylhydroperoxidase/carboxymuconolactone decarboxylase family protein YurZ
LIRSPAEPDRALQIHVARASRQKGPTDMASIKMVEMEEAPDQVKAIYQQIMDQLGTDFVPNMYKVMGHKPDFLEAQWKKTQAVMRADKLDSLTKEIIAVAVSAVSGCDY